MTKYIGFKVLTAVVMKSPISCDIPLRIPEDRTLDTQNKRQVIFIAS
jgi:hypothetical protein